MGFAAEIAGAEGGLPLVAAGGFRDMTRIAGSSPELWLGILRENRSAVLKLLMRFRGALEDTIRDIADGDWEGLRGTLEAAREGRARIPEKPGLRPAALWWLLVPVPDRPGVLAEVTTTMGEAGVNIEDLSIVHSPEGGRGTIHLEVSGEAAAQTARQALEKRGYTVQLTPGR
jgi:prephenate dehydrogenase